MSELVGHDEVQKSLFKQHAAKLLNFFLLLYLAFGAATFEYLEESVGNALVSKKAPSSLAELRQSSVRRMWNITNRLNILYEANWTALVLDELVDFERQLVESLERSKFENADQVEDDAMREDEESNEKKKEKTKKKNRSGSMKKSFVHSLATITTIGKRELLLDAHHGLLLLVEHAATMIDEGDLMCFRWNSRACMRKPTRQVG